MALADNSVLDTALEELATATRVTACTAEPANFAGIAAVTIDSYTLTAGSGNGDWTIADGDASGRKLTLGAQSGETSAATGAANFLAYDDGATLLFTTAGNGATINNGSPWTIGAYDVAEIADPT